MVTTCYSPQILFWKKHHKSWEFAQSKSHFLAIEKGSWHTQFYNICRDVYLGPDRWNPQRPLKWRIRPVWWTPFCLCQVAVKFSVAKNQVLGPKKDRVDVDAFWKPKKTLHFNESTDLRFTIFYKQKQKCQHTSAIKILPPAKKSSLLQIHRWLGQPGGFSSLWVPSSAFCQCALHCSRLLPHV